MKIGFFITARLKSSRLEQKIVLNLNGKAVIQRIIERCKAVHGVDDVVLCTSTNSQDSILYKYASQNDILFFPGSEDDVLERLLNAAKYYSFDAFVSITADNPLFSIYTSEILVKWYKKDGFDFAFTKGLPIGCGTYFLDVKALEIAYNMKKDIDTEIWGPFVNRPDYFNIGELVVENSKFKEEKRLTCDYTEDYKLISKIYNLLNKDIPSVQEVLFLLEENPDLFKINGMHNQRSLNNDEIKKIQNYFDTQKDYGLKIAQQINKVLFPSYKTYNINI